jgi:hypothetical protein
MTMFGRLRRAGRALAGVDESRLEGRLKEISDRLTKLEESLANLKPNIKMLPAIVRRLYLDDADLPPPYDLLSERFHYLSQNEEDGLLLALFKRIGTTNRRAVEIGCGLNGGNSGFLVQECGWHGLMVDANRHKIDTIKLRFSGHAATVVKHRVTRDDVNTLLATHGFTGEVDLLSIDVDGIDYWVWEAITACSPRVVALEYNWLFGPDKSVTVPYDENFEVGSTGTRSYRGASLTALVHLSRRKGYRLVASERVNAFFVRHDVSPAIPEIDVARAYRPPKNLARSNDVFDKIEQARLPLVTVDESGAVVTT